MIADQRTYTFAPGRLNEWLDLFGSEGVPAQVRHLGPFLGVFTVETGPINRVVFLRTFPSAGDRERRRAAMEADPAWNAFRTKGRSLGALETQENTLLTPVPWAPAPAPPPEGYEAIDHRTYAFAPGTLGPWLDLYREKGFALQQRHLGTLVGLFTSETGPVNRAVWLWAYRDAADRDRRRAAMEAESDWWAFRSVSDNAGAIVEMRNQILRPAPICPRRAA